uniref:C-type lectin domain-containing protein n=1 Tax=Sinocyclocheilus grahami TaxID=75366 RepID=A0A672K3A5_SINGR
NLKFVYKRFNLVISPVFCSVISFVPSVPMYQFMNQSMTWLDAQRYCRARFTDLAAVMTMNDVRRLVTTVDPGYNGSVWIGLHALGVGRWLWSMGDSAISQDSMWQPGEPSGDGECVRKRGKMEKCFIRRENLERVQILCVIGSNLLFRF